MLGIFDATTEEQPKDIEWTYEDVEPQEPARLNNG